MKILLTIEDISIFGGAERVVVNLANALSEQGHEVEVLSFYQGNKNLPYAQILALNCIFGMIMSKLWRKLRLKSTFSNAFMIRIFTSLF